jgi:hypothetical protein
VNIKQEPDYLDPRVAIGIVMVGVLGLVLGAILTLAIRAYAWQGVAVSEQPGRRPPLEKPELAGQQAWLFDRHLPQSELRSRPPALSGYGWVDRQSGLVRIPIERAKSLYVERAASAEPQKLGDAGGLR